MFKLRSIFSFLLLAVMMPYQGIIPAHAAAPQPALSAGNSTTSNFVNLYIDEIKFLGKTGDLTGQGEFRLIILAADTTGKSSGMFCPGNAPLKVRKGDIVKAPCLLNVSFNEANVSDGVYLTIIAVDEDRSTLPADISYEVAANSLGSAFGKAAKKGVIKAGLVTAAKSTPYTFAAEVLFSFLTSKLKEWIERADIIGSQGIYLSRKDGWSADKTKTVTSSDGGIQITYTIVRTSSTPPHQSAPVLGSTASPGSTTPQKYSCDDLSYVKLKVGDSARVVWPKVNLRTAPIVPMDYYENSIAKVEEKTKLTIIGGPACAHNGTWWQVRLKNGQTGWMRERISTGYLIGK